MERGFAKELPKGDDLVQVEALLTGNWRGATSALISDRRHYWLVDSGMAHEAPLLMEALKSRGLHPEDITAVINTHFHIDHVLNNSLFPQSEVYASQESYQWCCSLYSDLRDEANWEKLTLKYYPELKEYEEAGRLMSQLRKLALRWWDAKRLGDRSRFRWLETTSLPAPIEVIFTQGHVPGHASLVVHDGGPRTLIAGDALLTRDADARVLTMIPHNREQSLADRARLLALAGRILPGHGEEFVAREAAAANDAQPTSLPPEKP